MEKDQIKQTVKKSYARIVNQGSGCGCCSSGNKIISGQIGYSEEKMSLAPEANLGLGCGNPTALGKINPGEIVLDLGSGGGFDAFLAAKKVGESGKVIGVDMTQEMIDQARQNAENYDFKNVEFKLGDIEDLPVDGDSVDVVISNCVINLAPDKDKVFQEAFRVLKSGGWMYVSDIVLLKPLPPEIKNNPDYIAGCVGGAILKDEYIGKIKAAGFVVNVLAEDKGISKKQYQGMPLESLKVEAIKNSR